MKENMCVSFAIMHNNYAKKQKKQLNPLYIVQMLSVVPDRS